MAQDQEVSEPVHCPRCRGAMYRPAGSPFYWHLTNHPHCSITNLSRMVVNAEQGIERPKVRQPGGQQKK